MAEKRVSVFIHFEISDFVFAACILSENIEFFCVIYALLFHQVKLIY